MMNQFFVTATDTDAGKTWLSAAIMIKLDELGYKVKALKPISAGAELIEGRLINDDAKMLTEYANCGQAIEEVNPIVFKQPIAPHIAAKISGEKLSINKLNEIYEKFMLHKSDFSLIEGAGGWLLPLNDSEFLSDWVSSKKLSIVFVVDMKLGCLNHAMLTYQQLKLNGLNIIGWVANGYREMPYENENFDFLMKKIEEPCLGRVPKTRSPEEAAKYLDLRALLVS